MHAAVGVARGCSARPGAVSSGHSAGSSEASTVAPTTRGADRVGRVGERRGCTTTSPGRRPSRVGSSATSSFEPIVGSTFATSRSARRGGARTSRRSPRAAPAIPRSAGSACASSAARRAARTTSGVSIDRRPDRQVDDAVGMRARPLAVRGERRPRGSRGGRAPRIARPRQCACGGTRGDDRVVPVDRRRPWRRRPASRSVSSKNSTFAL